MNKKVSYLLLGLFSFLLIAAVGVGPETTYTQSFKLAASASAARGVLQLANSNTVYFAGLVVTNASANEYPMVRLTSDAGLPQLVLEDLDAADSQEPFWYFQSANNGSAGRMYLGYADRTGTNLTGNTDVLTLSTTQITVPGITVTGLTASLPLFTGASSELTTKSIVDARRALGIDSGSGTTEADGTYTNTFNITYSAAPTVFVQVTGGLTAVLTNAVSDVTETNFVINLGASSATYDWQAIGAP